MKQHTFRILPEGDWDLGLKPSKFTPVDAFTTNDKTELNNTFYQTSDDSILTGTWECAPCKEEFPDGYPVHEMMTVVSGSVTMTNSSEESETLLSGDVFFISKGMQCTWEITETLRKIYMIAS